MNNRHKFKSVVLLSTAAVLMVFMTNQYIFQYSARIEGELKLDIGIYELVSEIMNKQCPACYYTVQVLPNYESSAYRTPIVVDWFNYDNYKRKSKCKLKDWKRTWSNENHEHVMELLRSIHELLSRNGIDYSLCAGTLLGANRHLDLVPWDDDSDLIVDVEYRSKIKQLITDSKSDLTWVKRGNYIKVFRNSSTPVKGQKWNYPFVDVFFYASNESFVHRNFWGSHHLTPVEAFFPLKLRPVGKYWLPVPKNPSKVLETLNIQDSSNICAIGKLNHQNQRRRKVQKINCTDLIDCHLFTQQLCISLEGRSQEVCLEKYQIDATKTVYLLEYESRPVAVTIYRN